MVLGFFFLAFTTRCGRAERGSCKRWFSRTAAGWESREGAGAGLEVFTSLIYRNTALYNLCKAQFKLNNGEVGKTINTERKPEDQVNGAAWFPCTLCVDSSTAHRKMYF